MSYFVQLCAQALCLEEMLKTEVREGALYHGKSRRRQPVVFDAGLRSRTLELVRRLRELIAAGNIPPPEYGPKCKFCSLMPKCVPKLPRSALGERVFGEEHPGGAGVIRQTPPSPVAPG